jgi:hypothetical protein
MWMQVLLHVDVNGAVWPLLVMDDLVALAGVQRQPRSACCAAKVLVLLAAAVKPGVRQA